MNKKLLLLGFAAMALNSAIYADCSSASSDCGSSESCEIECASSKQCSGSKSFFRPRSIIEDVSMYFGLNNYYFHRKYFEPTELETCEPQNTHLARSVFIQQTRQSD